MQIFPDPFSCKEQLCMPIFGCVVDAAVVEAVLGPMPKTKRTKHDSELHPQLFSGVSLSQATTSCASAPESVSSAHCILSISAASFPILWTLDPARNTQTKQPRSMRSFAASKCPAHIAYPRAVMPCITRNNGRREKQLNEDMTHTKQGRQTQSQQQRHQQQPPQSQP